jgi:hypothetical protein
MDVNGSAYEAPVDGIQLLQDYVQAPRPVITRAGVTGGRFTYAVEVDTSRRLRALPRRRLAPSVTLACPVGEVAG